MKGNSGGPVVNVRGKVVGVVEVRARTADGSELPKFGGAVSIQSVRSFAPELFQRSH
jgi:S1-C subfamily serine protease